MDPVHILMPQNQGPGLWMGFTKGVHNTIKMCAQECSISVRDGRSNMTDQELNKVLKQGRIKFPNIVYRRVHSQLVSRAIRVSHLTSAGSNA